MKKIERNVAADINPLIGSDDKHGTLETIANARRVLTAIQDAVLTVEEDDMARGGLYRQIDTVLGALAYEEAALQ